MPDMAEPYAHPKCYASALGGCSTKITGEHFVSKAILTAMDELLRVQGLPWIPEGTQKVVTEGALRSNILCVVHNTLLSDLDAEALKLFEHIRTAVETLRWRSGRPSYRVLTVDGHKIERWLLKVLYGMVAAGNVSVGPDKVALESKPPFLDALFGMALLSPNRGLYLGIPRDEIDLFDGSISVASLSMKIEGIAYPSGIVLRFQGLVLVLALYGPSNEVVSRENLSNLVYRPAGHRIQGDESVVEIQFCWGGHGGGQIISATMLE